MAVWGDFAQPGPWAALSGRVLYTAHMRWLIASLLVCCAGAALAQDPVNAFMHPEMQARHIPGCSIAIVHGGKIDFQGGYGLADVENEVAATPQTIYELGSITKQFTATLIMILVEQNELALDRHAADYLPELPKAWKAVTLRELLNHTSGIPNYTELPNFDRLMREPGSKQDLIDLVAKQKLDFEPGTSWKYSNTGYFLLGMIIEKVTGKPYAQVLKERILDPLDMTSTSMNDSSTLLKHRARGYAPAGDGWKNAEYVDMFWPFSAGAMVSNVLDLAKWVEAQGSPKLLSPASWEQMWTPAKLAGGKTEPYGFGWSLGETNGIKVIEHGGSIPGFSAMISRYPERDLAVIVLVNELPAGAEKLAHSIAALWDRSLRVTEPAPTQDADPALTEKQRGIFENALKGKLDPGDFAESARKILFPSHVHDLQNAIGGAGGLTSFELSQDKKDGERRTRVYKAKLGSQTLDVVYIMDSQGKLVGFGVRPG